MILDYILVLVSSVYVTINETVAKGWYARGKIDISLFSVFLCNQNC
jgi:hypothetical protein